jgi:DNA-binding FadR family transcriptional regulator
MEAFGVSRTAVREGLRGLEAVGLVIIRHGSGVYVVDQVPQGDAEPIPHLRPNAGAALALVEVRLIVEPEISALAARRATDADLDRLHHDVEEFREQVGHMKRPPADLRFHVDLCRASHNGPLLTIVQWVIEFYARSGQLPQVRDVVDHERIYLAVRARDAQAAREAMRLHLTWVEESLEQSIATRRRTNA